MSNKETDGDRHVERDHRDDDAWPWYDCPECGAYVWYDGFDDATEVRGQDEYRSVGHCGVCEFVAISRAHGPHTWGEPDE